MGETNFTDLVSNYPNILPQSMYVSAYDSYENEIPKKWVNNFITVLNRVENQDLYEPLNNYDQAIHFFTRVDIDESIEKANTIEGAKFMSIPGEKLTIPQVLEANKLVFESGGGLL
ncbi:hypothetical protein [Flavobacterium tegetincola]|uniref:hypothetical protein n=1 Tax=Flavobacterium tegetincola TaxID=150172 RepID=UPI00047BD05C|nr:hypothetical protein [Flavobacterium tegetincola]